MLFQKELNILDYSDDQDTSTGNNGSSSHSNQDNKVKSSFDGLASCRTPSSRPLSAGPGVLTKAKQAKPNLEHRLEDDLKSRLHLQETLGNHSEVEKKDRSGRYIHPKRAPLDNRLQPLRRVSKAGLESATLDFLKEFDYEKNTPAKESIQEQPESKSRERSMERVVEKEVQGGFEDAKDTAKDTANDTTNNTTNSDKPSVPTITTTTTNW